MVQNLAQYVSEQLKKGHSIDSIRQYLVKYGYPQQDIEAAIKKAKQNNRSIPKPIIFGAILIIIGIFGIIFAINLLSQPQPETPYVQPPTPTPTPPQEPEVKINDSPTPTLPNQTDEDKNETPSQNLTEDPIEIPIIPDPEINLTPEKNESEQTTTPDFIPTPPPTQIEGPIDDSYDHLSLTDVLIIIDKQLQTSVPEAVAICKGLSTRLRRDSCFEKIALTLNQSSYCATIEDEDFKDQCLIAYMLKTEDYSICESLKNNLLRESCLTLREFDN